MRNETQEWFKDARHLFVGKRIPYRLNPPGIRKYLGFDNHTILAEQMDRLNEIGIMPLGIEGVIEARLEYGNECPDWLTNEFVTNDLVMIMRSSDENKFKLCKDFPLNDLCSIVNMERVPNPRDYIYDSYEKRIKSSDPSRIRNYEYSDLYPREFLVRGHRGLCGIKEIDRLLKDFFKKYAHRKFGSHRCIESFQSEVINIFFNYYKGEELTEREIGYSEPRMLANIHPFWQKLVEPNLLRNYMDFCSRPRVKSRGGREVKIGEWKKQLSFKILGLDSSRHSGFIVPHVELKLLSLSSYPFSDLYGGNNPHSHYAMVGDLEKTFEGR